MISILNSTFLGDNTVVGSKMLSMIPQTVHDAVNTVVGPVDDFSVGLYLKLLYQIVGTVCMMCCFSWMVARHYELKRSRRYDVPPRALGLPLLGNTCG